MNPWPMGIVAGLGIVVSVNIWMVTVAVGGRPIQEAERPYEAGVEFEKVLETRRASVALGYSAQVEVVDGVARIQLSDTRGAPVTGLRGLIEARRSDRADLDFQGEWGETAPGVYVASRPFPQGGHWRLQSRFEGGAAPFLDDRRLAVTR